MPFKHLFRLVTCAFVTLAFLGGGSAVDALSGGLNDPDDAPGKPDIKRVFHEDSGSEVVLNVEYYENLDQSANWPAPTCTWDFDFDGDTGVEMIVIAGASAQPKVYRVTYRSSASGNVQDVSVTGAATSSANSFRVQVPKAEMARRGLPAGATTYRYRLNCPFAGAPGPGASTGNDYVPNDRTFGVTHTFGAPATAPPTGVPAATVTPTPTTAPAATAAVTPAPTTKPADDDDSSVPVAAIAGGAAGLALIGGGVAYAMWRRRRDAAE